MKKALILIISFILLITNGYSQMNKDMQLKEFFDQAIIIALDSNKVKIKSVTAAAEFGKVIIDSITLGTDIAEDIAPYMEAELELFETTGDKGYLIQFINDALQVINNTKLCIS